jgi:hypothetical protein
MKICVIGNSHIAALKKAVEDGALDHTDANIVFFGAPGKNFDKLQVRDGMICGPATLQDMFLRVSDGLYTRIDPAEFDVVVVYAGRFYFHRLLGSIHRVLRSDVHLSKDCLSTGIGRWLTSKHVFRLARMIDEASPATRVVLVPRPIPAAGVADASDAAAPDAKSPWVWDTLEPSFRKKIWSICSQSASRRGVELFAQPDSTIDANQFTKPDFTTHSNRLLKPEVKHRQAEVSHMNARFGEVFLLSLLAHLSNGDERGNRTPDTTPV